MSNDLLSPQPPSEDLATKVLDRIEEEHVTPRPRWQFSVTRVGQWVLLVACLLFGAAVAAALIFAFVNAGWEFRSLTHDNWFAFISETAPVAWILIFVVLLISVIENFRHTKTGYRYRLSILLIAGLVGTLIVGGLLFAAGVGERFDQEIGPRLHLVRRPVMTQQQQMWTNPVRGLLAGEVISIDPDASVFRLRTFDGNEWTVAADDLSQKSRDALFQSRLVRVVGLPISAGIAPASGAVFRSCIILPWLIRGLPGDMMVPPPTVASQMRVSIKAERNALTDRTTDCESSRPYLILKKLRYDE